MPTWEGPLSSSLTRRCGCRSPIDLLSAVSRNLPPAPNVQRLADSIVAGITGSSRRNPAPFNGLHLRLEKDAGYLETLGGLEVRPPSSRGVPGSPLPSFADGPAGEGDGQYAMSWRTRSLSRSSCERRGRHL